MNTDQASSPAPVPATDSPLVRVLQDFFGWARDCLFLYHDADDFDRLWSLEPGKLTRPILIYWQGFPQGEKLGRGAADGAQADETAVDAFVTPYHWALAFARSLADGSDGSGTIHPVYVLHAIPSGNYDIWDGLGARCRTSLAWLHGVSLEQTVAVPLMYPFLHGFDTLKFKGVTATVYTCTASGLQSLIKSLRSDFVVDPNDHHSIANLVGPVALAGALGVVWDLSKLAKSPQRRALSKLLKVFDWIEAGQRRPPFAEERIYDVDVDPCGAFANVRYWLVDDQAGMGYGEVLADALGETLANNESTERDTGRTVWWREGSGADLVDDLLSQMESPAISDWAMPRLIKDIDVLLLDLRLWLRWPSTRDKHPLAGVVHKAAQLLGSDSAGVPTNAPDLRLQEAMAAALVAIGKNDANYPAGRPDEKTELVALTLLPLLLSHYDPSLPIVVFSSTRQREVAKRLGHRPNIHLQFVKPGITVQGAAESTTRQDLRDALRAALRQHQLRVVWARIVNLELKHPAFPQGLRARLPGERSTYRYLDAHWQLDKEKATGQRSPETRRRLAGLYLQLLRGDVNALMSGCYELLEAAFSSVRDKRYYPGIELVWPRHWTVGRTREEQQRFRFSLIAVALQKIRNLKAHGQHHHADPAHQEPNAVLACAAMVVALVDFLEQRDRGFLTTRLELSSLVKQHPVHYPDAELDRCAPWELSKLNGACGSDTAFIVYALISVLDTVRCPPINSLRGTSNFASDLLANFCLAFICSKAAMGETTMGDAGKKKPNGNEDPQPIRLVGWFEGGPASSSFTQLVIPLGYAFEPSSDEVISWVRAREGLCVAARALNRDARLAFDDSNAWFYQLPLQTDSAVPRGDPDSLEGADSGKLQRVQLKPPELVFFAPLESQVAAGASPQRIALLVLDFDFVDGGDLNLDDVLAFNHRERNRISSLLGRVRDGEIGQITLADLIPDEYADQPWGKSTLEAARFAPVTGYTSRSFKLTGLRPLSAAPFVHTVITVAGDNKGVVAFYEGVRNEAGDAPDDETAAKGTPQECADLHRLLVVDLPESLPKRNDAFTEVWLAARTYNRSARDGVCYAFDYNSACLVAGEDDASRRDFVEPSRTLYFLQWMHLLYMRTAISAFSERVAELTRETPNDKGFDQLHLELQQFENVHNFPFICDERRSRDLYPKARAAVDLDNYLDELTKEVRMTSDYYNRRTASRVSMGSLWFAGVASAVGFVALMFGFLGMNILDNEAICALQRGLGDSGTSHCEAALKGKIKSELATSLPPEAEKTLDRTSYVQLCRNKPLSPDTVGPDLMAVSQFVPVVKKECDNFDKTYLDALQQGYTESSRWVVVSVLMLVPAMLAMLVIFGFVTWFFARRRFRRR